VYVPVVWAGVSAVLRGVGTAFAALFEGRFLRALRLGPILSVMEVVAA
jgi:hypothetical protein